MINIAVALNRKVIPQVYVLLHSISVNNTKEDICVYVLHSELIDTDCEFLSSALSFSDGHNAKYLKIEREDIPDLPFKGFWSIETYYRLLLTDVLPEKIDRILYLDIDMIVNGDISDFYHMDFESKALIVSEDMEFFNLMRENREDHRLHDELFSELCEEGMTYFCAGMILYNISLLREKGYFFEKYMKVFFEYKDYFPLNDQDLLNFVHWKNLKFVDNMVYGVFAPSAHTLGKTYQDIKEGSKIIHFTGAAKPWTVNLLRYDIEKIWWEYAKDAPFYHDLMEEVFLNSMESVLTENMINGLLEEKETLLATISEMKNLFSKIL